MTNIETIADGGLSRQGNPRMPSVSFALLDELYGIRLEDAGRLTPPGGADTFKDGELSASDLERAAIKHARFSHEIATNVVEGKPANLEATTLFVFNGPCINRVRVEDHVNSWMLVKPHDAYGKLSLRPPHRKYGKTLEVAGHLVRAGLGMSGFLFVHNLYLAARAIKQEKGKSQIDWERVFNKTGQYDEPRLSVGEGSFIAMKGLARSDEARKALRLFTKTSGASVSDILGDRLKMDLSEYPLIYTKTNYFIPYQSVDAMLRQGSHKVGEPRGPPQIILLTGIEAQPFYPNLRETGHWIYTITKISGVDQIYLASLGFHGPEFYVRQSVPATPFSR